MSELYRKCTLCPRECGANRLAGETGACGAAGATVKVARAALHFWEEPCLSGSEGSGAVFFSYCPLHCVYCQNQEISGGKAGKEITVERLADIFLELQEKKAHNINLVTPTHYTPQIAEALTRANAHGLSIPVVCNCGGYEKPETLRLLNGLVDVYLPDFKYSEPETANRYSLAPDYFERAKEALAEMVSQVGDPVFDLHGIMQKGVIVRHLLLPGRLCESKKIVKYLYETYGNRIYLSLMNQYTPVRQLPDFPELKTTVPKSDYDALVKYALRLGVENGFIQEGGTADESFIPPFDCEGV